ncbi:hypothetical protein FT641_19915 [Bacillus paranthracis]|uniref:hypothetical protein n=1 Tax=Bacillus paranthracis TaxID=2026186 RepID=UPI001879788C|nr:hypothetical protein [Bacillus paranthracis]MBE7114672.1 hypothetical protein [Bacillus paranthracis]MBE7154961.1 hypothetical protein [Bacillus paranthracis]
MSQSLIARYETAKKKFTNTEKQANKVEARLGVKKEEVKTKVEALAKRGITFETKEELDLIIEEKNERVLEIVEHMETALDMEVPVDTVSDTDSTGDDDDVMDFGDMVGNDGKVVNNDGEDDDEFPDFE